MSCSITDFQGRQVLGTRSLGSKVFAAYDWQDMVLKPGAEVVRKAKSEKGQTRHFPPEDRERLKVCLGHYSKLQSENSEDTVTWSVFGASPFNAWLPEVLAQLFDEPKLPATWSARFWERQPHPDTGISNHGPESEITLLAEGWCIEVEAKWLSDFDGNQGKKRQTSQLEMRSHTAVRNCGSEGNFGVLVVVPSPHRYPPAKKSNSVFRSYFDVEGESYACRPSATRLKARIITWERLAEALDRNGEFQTTAAYLRWRLNLLDCSLQGRSGSA